MHTRSDAGSKVAFFRAMFACRQDAYATRWENTRTGRAGWVPAVPGGWRRGSGATRPDYLPLTDEVVTAHLSGQLHLGLYPLLRDNRCHWMAADFDGSAALLDALAYVKAARALSVPTALEVSGPASARTPGRSSPAQSPPPRSAASRWACCGRR